MPARTYEIRLSGLVPAEALREQIGDVDVVEPQLGTVLSARFVDQAQLHGFLNRLQSLGLEVVEVRRSPTHTGTDTPTADEGP